MKTVTERPSFQGDVMVRRISALPKGVKSTTPENGAYIVAHSETGHHHVIDSRAAQLLIDKTNEFLAYLDVREPCDLTHMRDFDTHEPLHFEPGIYEVRREQEFGPEGWQRALD
jgi:hypothetical protein